MSDWLQENAIPEPNSGCWLWTGGANADGYGYSKDGKHRAHRLSWERHRGPIPTGKIICHKCDVRLCINPDHLFVGTTQDNVADRVRKGRTRTRGLPGMLASKAKLTDEQALAIRADKRSQYVIGREYNIDPSVVCRIRTGKYWKHLP